MNVLAALVILIVAAGVTLAEQVTCQHFIRCPCGRTNKNITVCTQERRKDDICSRWSECKTCQDGLNRCLECPEGLEGPLCKTATRRERLKRQLHSHQQYHEHRRRPNSPQQQSPPNTYPTSLAQLGGDFCPELNSPKLGSIRCLTNERRRTCVGTCLPGYSFEGRGSDHEITLTCTGDYFTPLREFPPCKSGGYCDLIVQGAGSFNCTTGMTGTRCDVICDSRYIGRYFCYPGENWKPRLPYCIQPKEVEVDQACLCEYGGSCDRNGICMCPVGRTGRFCETIVPEKETCTDPGFVTNGFRRNLDESDSSIRRMFDEGETVVYDCVSEEFALQGSSILTCKSDGTWSKPRPKCISSGASPGTSLTFCQDPGVDPNGSRNPRSPSSPRGFPQGIRLEYSCNEGYILDGDKTLFCLDSGKWLSQRPKCNPQPRQPGPGTRMTFCSDPGVDPNGSRQTRSTLSRQGFPQGTRLQYSCNRGYDLDGERSVFCLISGEWSSGIPRCNPQSREPGPNTPNYCRDPGVDPNGSRNPRSPSSDQGFPQGTELEYFCNQGYVLEGDRRMFCLTSGEWLSRRPSCNAQSTTAPETPKYCSNPGSIVNGRVVYLPALNERNPPRLPDPDRGGSVLYPQGSRLQYSCDNGYSLDRSSGLTCEASGRWSSAPPNCVTACGESVMGTTRKILNGNKTVVGEWPWVVAITERLDDFTTGRVLCGGAVLNRQTVITAAHCLEQAPQFTLFFGKYYRTNSLDDSEVLNRTSDRLIVHPDFDSESMDSDIGLITFKPEIPFSDRVKPICLPTGESTAVNVIPGKKGFVTGWGLTERRLGSAELLMAHLPVVSSDDCRESFRQNVPNFNLVLTQNMFCAGYSDARQSTCVGDSGSPIVFYDRVTERYTLEGLVSFGVEGQCGLPGTYSMFAKVNRFLPWIIRNMQINV